MKFNNKFFKFKNFFYKSLILILLSNIPCININSRVYAQISNDISIKNSNFIEYILGPLDDIFIAFYGIEDFSQTYSIDKFGFLKLPEIEEIYVKGLTVKELKNTLVEKYKQYLYDPNIDITVKKYRPIEVYVLGEVKRPGLYTFNEFDRLTPEANSLKSPFSKQSYAISSTTKNPKLFDLIKSSGGIKNTANLRKIKVIRINPESNGGGKVETELDLLSMILEGDQTYNISIYDGDLLEIPKTNKNTKEQILEISKSNLTDDSIDVYVTGMVPYPGLKKLKKGSSLLQGISVAGGKKKLISGKVEFLRFNDDGTSTRQQIRYNSNSSINSKNNPLLVDGDIINVRRSILENTTNVLNQVSSPVLSGLGLIKIFSD